MFAVILVLADSATSAPVLAGTTRSLRGIATDAATRVPIAGATVTVQPRHAHPTLREHTLRAVLLTDAFRCVRERAPETLSKRTEEHCSPIERPDRLRENTAS
jgi:hypothetical protein